ncbi:MAG: putative motility protein [Planctomycetota bacterium]
MSAASQSQHAQQASLQVLDKTLDAQKADGRAAVSLIDSASGSKGGSPAQEPGKGHSVDAHA